MLKNLEEDLLERFFVAISVGWNKYYDLFKLLNDINFRSFNKRVIKLKERISIFLIFPDLSYKDLYMEIKFLRNIAG